MPIHVFFLARCLIDFREILFDICAANFCLVYAINSYSLVVLYRLDICNMQIYSVMGNTL